MGARRKGFMIAALVSIADMWITAYRGPAIWQVWSRTPLYRIDILLLSGTGSFTRADIWAKTFAIASSPGLILDADATSLEDPLPRGGLEGADV
jgi:hypothetical protein